MLNVLRGFTLIELLIAVAVLFVAVVAGAPTLLRNYRGFLLSAETKNFVTVIRRAESEAFANARGAYYGVKIEPNSFILFQGMSFSTRNPDFDRIYSRDKVISFSGPMEVAFAPISGLPVATGTWTLSNGTKSQAVSVNSEGTVEW